MSNPAFELIGLEALRNDPRYAEIDGDAPDRDDNGQPDQRLTVVVLDTGVDTDHQLLSPNIVAYVDFIDGDPVVTNNAPTITSTAFTSPENTTDVGTIAATDPEGSALTFDIVGGADGNLFSIDRNTGALTFRSAPDYEEPADTDRNRVYDLTVRVSDGQNLFDQNISVTVSDVEEILPNLAPTFTSLATFSIVENETDTTIGTVTATDPTGDDLSYSISGGADQNRLTVDAQTGVLSFTRPRDFENPRDAGRNNVYDIEVSVTDGQNTTTQNIAVRVTDNEDERVLLTGVLSDSNDPDGHGTHVSGIIGSTDPDIGVANNVDLIGLRVLGENQDGSEVTQALQWVLDNRAEYNIVAVNMSLGIPSAFYTQRPDEGTSDQGTLVQADPIYSTWRRLISELEDAGITVVSAAGNSYAENADNSNLRENVSIPAIASTAAVGAVWEDDSVSNARWNSSRDRTTDADRLVSFGQRLSSYDGMLFAPGAVIESTLPGDQIGGLAGTSMAAPMVSGTVALMQDAALTFGHRLLTPNEIRQILRETADTIVDGDDEDTNVTATGSSYRRIDVYHAVQAVDRLFTVNPGPTDPSPTDPDPTEQFFRFVFNSSLQSADFYQGYGYANANTYQVGQSVDAEGGTGTYTITEALADQSGTAGEVVVTDYYDGSTGFGYAIYVDANGIAGLGSESGFAYDGDFGGVDPGFSANDTADLQAAPTVNNQLYYFTYTYGNGDSYSGYGYTDTPYTVGRVPGDYSNETNSTGYYTIDSVYTDNNGSVGSVFVYNYYDGTDGNGDLDGGGYGYASYASGYGSGGLGTESGYAYDYNYASTDTYFGYSESDSVFYEANLWNGVETIPTVQLYYFTYTYGNGDSYQGYGYAAAGTYTSDQIIPAAAPNDALNEIGSPGQYTGQYTIDSVYNDSYGVVGEVYVNSYYDGADGNGNLDGGSYGYAYDVYGYGFGGLGSESGYAYDYNYVSTDVFFSSVDEANLVSQQASNQYYTFTYYYGGENGDFYEGYGYAAADAYTLEQQIDQGSPNETGSTGFYIINSVSDFSSSYYYGDSVTVTRYYDGADGNGSDAGGGYGYAYSAYGYGYAGLGSESGYAYDNNYVSTDVYFDTQNEANLVRGTTGANQLYYFTYNYGNGDFYSGYGYAAAGTYTQGQQLLESTPNETREIGYYSIDAIYDDNYGYLGSVSVNYYYDADTGYGPAYSTYGYGYEGLGSESGYAYDINYLSTDTYFDKYSEVDLSTIGSQNQLYYFTYYYGGENGDSYQGYGYAAADTYQDEQRIDQPINETENIGYYQITDVYDVSYGSVGQVSIYSYNDNDVDTGYGPAYSVWAEGYSGLGSESGYAYDYYYSSTDPYFDRYYEADLSTVSTPQNQLYYFTYYYGGENGDSYQGYGYAAAGTYSVGRLPDDQQPNSQPNETGNVGYYEITDVHEEAYYSSTGGVYVYNYYDADTGYGWAWSAWGEGYDGLGSEYGYAYDYNYITTDPFFGNGGDSTFYEADLLINFGADTNPTLATATNLGVISQRDLSVLDTPNLDTPNTANFNLGSDPDSNGPVPADVDMYRFELPSAGTVSLETSLPTGGVNMDTILRLFDAFGNELGTDDDTGPDFYSRINAYLEAGSYYFGVSGYANFSYSPNSANSGITGSNGDYAVSIAFDPTTEEFVGDPNGTATGARDIGALSNFATVGGADVTSIIGLDTNVQGVDPTPENLVSVGDTDVDLIKFTVDPGLVIFQTSDYVRDYVGKFGAEQGQVYLDLLDSDRDGHFDDSIDTVLRLFDANGSELAIDDDGGEGLLSRLEYVFAESGTYYLGVSGYGNSSYDINTLPENVATDPSRRSGSTGSSLLSIILQPAADEEDELAQDPNGVFYGAIPVDLLYGSSLTRSERIGTDSFVDGRTIEVDLTGDVDLYRFTANETGIVLIDVDTATSPLNTYLRVFDEDGIALPTPYFSDNDAAEDFNNIRIDESGDESGNNPNDSFVRLDVVEGRTYLIGVSSANGINDNPQAPTGNQTYTLTNLNDRPLDTNLGDYTLNLQYGGGGSSGAITDANGYIHANLRSIDLTSTNTGTRTTNSERLNIGRDDQTEVGSTDLDFVQVSFTGNAPRILTATADGTGASQNAVVPTLYVFDGSGDQLGSAVSSSNPNTVQVSLLPGTNYYVGVAGYGNEGFNPLIMGSGRSASQTGNYTLDLSLSGSDLALLTGILNAANQRGTLYGNSLDFDLDLFGAEFGTPTSYTLSSTPRTILASLGEDIDQYSETNTAEETNAFGRLYLAAQGLTGTALNVTATSSDVGADDVDIYPIEITEAGTYQFTTSGTGIAIDDARPTFKLFTHEGVAVTLTNYGPQGLVTGNALADLTNLNPDLGEPDYYFVVMATGSGTDQFTFGNDPGFGTTALTQPQLREFYQSTGNYQLDMLKVSLGEPINVVDGTSFAQEFSLPLNVASLQLYGASGITPSLAVTAPNDSPVPGSLVYDEDNRTLRFVPTNPLLSEGDYTITYTEPSDFQAERTSLSASVETLETSTFNVTTGNPVVYLPSFARGPGQAVNIGGNGIPVSISNTAGLTNIRITVDYDTDALNITGAELASGLTGWELVGTPIINNGQITVDVRDITTDTTNNPLGAGNREIIRLIADVPNNALFNSAEVLEVSASARAGSQSVTISDSTAVQKVRVFGDINNNGGQDLDIGDVITLRRLVGDRISGFDFATLTDPSLLVDANSNGGADIGDVLVFRRAISARGDDRIPSFPEGLTSVLGLDPTITISDVSATQSSTARVDVVISNSDDAPDGIGGINLFVNFDPSKLSIASSNSIVLNQDIVNLGYDYTRDISNAATGLITVRIEPNNDVLNAEGPSITGTPTLFSIDFLVNSTATLGSSTITLEDDQNGGRSSLSTILGDSLDLTPVNGTITIAGDAAAPTLTIAATDATQTEGNSGTKAFTFTVTRDGDTTSASTAAWAVTGSGANAADAADFGGTLPTGTVSFDAGQTTSEVITVNVSGDITVEPDQGFTVTLSNPTNATLTTATATGTIQNDDVAVVPTVTIAATDATQTEGNSGTKAFTFTVTRDGDTTSASTAAWAVTGSGANAADAADFGGTLPTGTVSFDPGQTTSEVITVNVSGDITVEPDQGFTVTLSNPTNATLTTATATGTIQNDDVAVVPTVTIAATDANAAEAGVDPGQFTVTLSEAAAEDITVTYTVGGNSTATPTSDYTALSGTVRIAAGDTTETIAVIPVDDAIVEVNESVILTLTGGATYNLGATTTATVTIADDSPVDIDGNGTVTTEDVFLINQYLLLEGNGNRDSILQSTFDLFDIQGATNTTGAALSAAIEPQLSLFDIDGNGRTTGSDVFLINQYLLFGNTGLEEKAILFGNDLNGPINTGAELSAALSSLVG